MNCEYCNNEIIKNNKCYTDDSALENNFECENCSFNIYYTDNKLYAKSITIELNNQEYYIWVYYTKKLYKYL